MVSGTFDGSISLKYQCYARNATLIYNRHHSIVNNIVKQCISNAMHNTNTVIGLKLAYLREQFNIDVFKYNINYCIRCVQPATLSTVCTCLI